MAREVQWLPRSEIRKGQHPYRPAAFLCCLGRCIIVAGPDFTLDVQRIHRQGCANRPQNAGLVAPWEWVQVRVPRNERTVSDAEVQRFRSLPYVETIERAREAARRDKASRSTLRLAGVPAVGGPPEDGGAGRREPTGRAVRVRGSRSRKKG